MTHTLGWLGTGRVGSALVGRLLAAGHDASVWNRTRSKTGEHVAGGAKVVDTIARLAAVDIVFVTVSTPQDLEEVVLGPNGLLAGEELPAVIIDCSTVDAETSERVRQDVAGRGVEFLASPASGNPRVVAEGEAMLVASGPRETFDLAQPYLVTLGKGAVYAGEGETARLVKICHNLFLGLLVQSVSEVTALAEKAGASRGAFLDFLNSSVLATPWVQKRTPDLMSLDWTPTFTTELLRKDFDLGLAAARASEVPMPLTSSVQQLIQTAIGRGFRDADSLSLFQLQVESSGMKAESK